MQLFSYLSRIASGGSLLAWDGTKIIPFKPITQDAFTGAISVSGTLTTDAIVTHDLIAGNKIKALGGLYGSLTELADGSPYIQAGENINVITTSLGSIEISGKEQTSVLWRWNESDVSQFNINCDTIGSGSSGAYSGPVFGGDDEFWERSRSETPNLKESDGDKVEAKEATGFTCLLFYSASSCMKVPCQVWYQTCPL